jgi:hypothetical protein
LKVKEDTGPVVVDLQAESDQATPTDLLEFATHTPFFDLEYYVAHGGHGASLAAALDDYLGDGEAAGLRPSKHFDPAFYLLANPDVGQANLSPFLHFARFGRAEGRYPSRRAVAPEVALLVREGYIQPSTLQNGAIVPRSETHHGGSGAPNVACSWSPKNSGSNEFASSRFFAARCVFAELSSVVLSFVFPSRLLSTFSGRPHKMIRILQAFDLRAGAVID